MLYPPYMLHSGTLIPYRFMCRGISLTGFTEREIIVLLDDVKESS